MLNRIMDINRKDIAVIGKKNFPFTAWSNAQFTDIISRKKKGKDGMQEESL